MLKNNVWCYGQVGWSTLLSGRKNAIKTTASDSKTNSHYFRIISYHLK